MYTRNLFGLALVTVLLAFPSALADEKPLQRIAFGSCADQEREQPIWDVIVRTQPQLFLFIGDNIYADTQDMEVMQAKYDKLAAKPGYKKLVKTCPILATWDDHDYGVNDGGAEYPKKRESQQVFLDFFGVDKDSPRRKREGVYHAEVFGPAGKRVQIILLDTRYHRSPLKRVAVEQPDKGPYVANEDEDATFLGAEQWKWLEEQLRIPAELRLIASSIQVIAEDHGWEKWMNFPRERARLFQLIKKTGASGVVFLSGDRHLAELSLMAPGDRETSGNLDNDVGYPLYDLTSSGLNQGYKEWRPQETNRHRVSTMNVGDNFGLITIDWNRKDPQIYLQIRDEEGDVRIGEKLALSALAPPKVKPNSPADAARNVGKEFTLVMEVKSVGKTRLGSKYFLNSEKDYRSSKNFTVVLDMKKLGDALKKVKIADPRKHYEGKTIWVKGKVTQYRGRPQMVVTNFKQITLVKPTDDKK